MSYSCKKSFNNSSFNKEVRKALDAHDASASGDFGTALAAVSSARRVTLAHKLAPRAPSASLQTPDKAIMAVAEEKLKVRKEDDFEFAVKETPKKGSKMASCPSAPVKAKIVDRSFFAATSIEDLYKVPVATVATVAPAAPVATAAASAPSWRNRTAK
jgi:hypothetical protein